MPVTVSHAVLSYAADGKVVSPNGDGRRDTVNLTFFLAQPATVALTLDTTFSTPRVAHRQPVAGEPVVCVHGTDCGRRGRGRTARIR